MRTVTLSSPLPVKPERYVLSPSLLTTETAFSVLLTMVIVKSFVGATPSAKTIVSLVLLSTSLNCSVTILL